MNISHNHYWRQANRKMLGCIALCSLLLVNAAVKNYEVLDEKARQQTAALSELNRWKAEYMPLLPVQKQWNEQITSVAEVKDIYSVYQAIRLEEYGLESPQEKLLIKEITPFSSHGTPMNATRICINTAGETGLAVSAPHFSELFDGLERLAARRDVEISNLTISTVNNQPKAVAAFCLIFRN